MSLLRSCDVLAISALGNLYSEAVQVIVYHIRGMSSRGVIARRQGSSCTSSRGVIAARGLVFDNAAKMQQKLHKTAS